MRENYNKHFSDLRTDLSHLEEIIQVLKQQTKITFCCKRRSSCHLQQRNKINISNDHPQRLRYTGSAAYASFSTAGYQKSTMHCLVKNFRIILRGFSADMHLENSKFKKALVSTSISCRRAYTMTRTRTRRSAR